MPDPGVRLNQLLDRFTARVRAQIESNRLFQHGIEVDDVVQEVRIRLWKALERDPNADFPASYIQKVVATTVVDSIRRAQVRAAEPMPDTEGGEAEFPDRAPEPDHAAVDAQQVAHVAACIAQLNPRRRRPLQLYLQGFQLQEIADLSGLTLDAARKLVYRGLDEVKERLRALGME